MIFLLTLTPVRLGIEEDLVPASIPNPRAASEEAADSVAARGVRYLRLPQPSLAATS
jgi:hypothetical protein